MVVMVTESCDLKLIRSVRKCPKESVNLYCVCFRQNQYNIGSELRPPAASASLFWLVCIAGVMQFHLKIEANDHWQQSFFKHRATFIFQDKEPVLFRRNYFL